MRKKNAIKIGIHAQVMVGNGESVVHVEIIPSMRQTESTDRAGRRKSGWKRALSSWSSSCFGKGASAGNSGSRMMIIRVFLLRVKTAVSRSFVLAEVHVDFWIGVVFQEIERHVVDEVHNVQYGPENLWINGMQK